MTVEFDISPDMIYDSFSFYEGEVELTYPFSYEKKYIINIWGVDIYIYKEKIKNQLSQELIDYLKNKFKTDNIFEGKYKSFFINGISELSFYDVDEIKFNIQLIKEGSIDRIKNEQGKNIVLKYIRESKEKRKGRQKFDLPDTPIYFPNGWMYGYLYAEKNAKLKINFEQSILLDDYLGNYKKYPMNIEKNLK